MFRPLRPPLKPPQAVQKKELPPPRLWDIVDERIFAFPLDVPPTLVLYRHLRKALRALRPDYG